MRTTKETIEISELIRIHAHIPLAKHDRKVLSPNELVALCAIAHYQGLNAAAVADKIQTRRKSFQELLRKLHSAGYLCSKPQAKSLTKVSQFYTLSNLGAEMCAGMFAKAIKSGKAAQA